MLCAVRRHVAFASHFRHFGSTAVTCAAAGTELLRLQSLDTSADHKAAREWVDGFGVGDIPKEALAVSYSRSSGPGGQHVNKTNSKATVKCDLAHASWLPPFVLTPLRRSPHYLASSNALQLSSQTTRSAGDNLEHATRILHESIVKAARSVIVGETSEAQKARVKGLARAEEGRRRDMKEKRSSKKASRRDW